MRTVDVILKKRGGQSLNHDEIRHLVQGYVEGKIPDYQIAAWLMAIYFQGMSFEETGDLTRVMIDSGEIFHLDGVKGPFVDKHSTGGVGDKISLILAPLAAACGLKVPMMSGRALGHTGGTLDKLESITGYSTALSSEALILGLNRVGYVMTGQSAKVVPADRLMYALRDVTGTVESIPLITASILSKKFAEGAQSLVFDVKCGRGAFMKTREQARALAQSLVQTGQSLGRKIVALITDMEEPLGRMVGNFLEVEESIRCLEGQGPEDLMELTYRQNAWMLFTSGLVGTLDEGLERGKARIADGSALKKFYENVEFQGGNLIKLKQDLGKRRSYYYQDLIAKQEGWIQGYDAYAIGRISCNLGAGRNTKEDTVHPNVGIEFLKKRGDPIQVGDSLCRVYSEDEEKLRDSIAQLQETVFVSSKPLEPRPLILEEISTP